MVDILVLNNRSHEPIEEFLRKIFQKTSNNFDVKFIDRNWGLILTTLEFIINLLRTKPNAVWVVGSGFSSFFSVLLGKFIPGTTVVFFHNDFTYLRMRDIYTSNEIGWVRLQVEKIQEGGPLYMADQIVTMSDYHEDYLTEKGVSKPFIRVPHGVNVDEFNPNIKSNLRSEWMANNDLLVGIVATFNWSKSKDIGYGWSLVESLQYLQDEPVTGVFIGEGDGIEHLQRRAEELGVTDSTVFTGRVSHEEIPKYMATLDVGILVLTDHPADRMKPTLKLPEYLASGLYIVCDDNGVAASILDDCCSSILPYDGIRDGDFPKKLGEELQSLCLDSQRLAKGSNYSREIAEDYFAYEKLQETVYSWAESHIDH